MKSNTVETLFKESVKGLLAVGLSIIGFGVGLKACHRLTGDELLRVHRFNKDGRQGAVVGQDTMWNSVDYKAKPK